jgi:hypothetical protein
MIVLHQTIEYIIILTGKDNCIARIDSQRYKNVTTPRKEEERVVITTLNKRQESINSMHLDLD